MSDFREEERLRQREYADMQDRLRRQGEAFRNVAATADGRAVLRWVMEQGAPFKDEFSPNSTLAYNAGLKAVSRRLFMLLEEHARLEDFVAICTNRKDGETQRRGECHE